MSRTRRTASFAALVLVLLAALPATAGADSLKEIVPFETTARDGTALRGDVYLPDREGPLATVLQLSPYWNTANKGPGESQAGSEAVAPFVEAGFAVALVNLRGTGESDGCFQFGGRVDWDDTYDVVEALADEPFANGKVGMYGTSYEGWTQAMALGVAPPSLAAVVPISGVIDVWSLLTRQGAPISVGPVTALVFGGTTAFGTTAEQAVVDHLGCAEEFAEHTAEGAELARSGDRSAYWRERDVRPALAGSEVPMLMANGLGYFNEAHELQFEGLWDLLAGERRFMLGQWGHGGKREDFNALAVGWFDHYLRGGPQATEPGVVEYQDDAGGWHTADRWPPVSSATALHLSGGRLVARAGEVERSSRSFQSADADTAADASDVASEAAGGPGNGPVCGPHQLLYTSPPIAEDVLVAGNFDIDLPVTSTLPGGNLVATLYHTAGDASCADLFANAQDASRAQLDLRHWREPGASRDFPVGRRTQVAADSLPLAVRIPAGHRLVLAIGSGSAEIEPDPLKPRLAIDTGRGLAGSLTLPIADGRLRFRR